MSGCTLGFNPCSEQVVNVQALIADENPAKRVELEAILQDAGIDVTVEATDGSEAIRRYKHRTPDICFLAKDLPTFEGIEAGKTISLTAQNMDEDVDVFVCAEDLTKSEAHEAVAILAGVLWQPYDRDDVLDVLDDETDWNRPADDA